MAGAGIVKRKTSSGLLVAILASVCVLLVTACQATSADPPSGVAIQARLACAKAELWLEFEAELTSLILEAREAARVGDEILYFAIDDFVESAIYANISIDNPQISVRRRCDELGSRIWTNFNSVLLQPGAPAD